MQSTREFLVKVFQDSLSQLQAQKLIWEHQDKIISFTCHHPAPLLLAVGKAAADMSQALAGSIKKFHPLSFVTRVYAPLAGAEQSSDLQTILAGHPLPNEQSFLAATRALHAVATVDAATPIILAISGGASAAWCAPVQNLSRDEVVSTWKQAMRLGLDIKTLNLLRRSLSAIKGGGLLRAAGHKKFLNLALLDVVDGRPEDLGSGPGVCAENDDARQWQKINPALKNFSPRVRDFLRQLQIQPVQHQSAMANASWLVLADPSTLRSKTLQQIEQGRSDLIVDKTLWQLQGAVEQQAEKISSWLCQARPGQLAVLSGENEIALPDAAGHGGRAQHLALSVLQKMRSCRRDWSLISVASDGRDGNSRAAGAFVDEQSLKKYSAAQCQTALKRAESADLFAGQLEQIVTGATGTNLCDLLVAWAR